MAENIPKLMKDIMPEIQETEQTPNTVNKKKSTLSSQ